MKKISCIIVNYNTYNYTIECIKSILKKNTLDYEIIVVDNKSKKEDLILLEKSINELQNKDIYLIKSKKNLGFSGGNMLGVNKSKGEYLVFINNDTLLLNNSFSILIKYLENNRNCGIVGGQSYTENGKLMKAFDHFPTILNILFRKKILEFLFPKKYPNRYIEYKNPIKVDFIQGSLMIISRKDFFSVEGFDTNIFLYYEETDLCKKLLKIKKECFLVPDAKYIHYHGKSSSNPYVKIEGKISLLYLLKKHYGYFSYLFVLIFYIIRTLLSLISNYKYYFPLFKVLIQGGGMKFSMKNKQK